MRWQRAGNIGDRIRDLRTALNLTQAAFGEIAGVEGQQVSDWETGRSKPRTNRLEKLAGRLRIPATVFQEGGPMPSTLPIRPAGPSNGGEGTPGARSRAPGRRRSDHEGELRAKAARLEVILATLKVYRDRGLMPGPGIIDDWLQNRDEPSPHDPGHDGGSPPR